jgi:hypothetical protein
MVWIESNQYCEDDPITGNYLFDIENGDCKGGERLKES